MDDEDSNISVGKDNDSSSGESCISFDNCNDDDTNKSTSFRNTTAELKEGSEDTNSTYSNTPENRSSSSSSRNPTCAACQNHGLTRPLKGHKRYCKYIACTCPNCRITRAKRLVNAAQVANRRAKALEQEHASSLEESGSATPSEPPPPEVQPVKKDSQSIRSNLESLKRSSSSTTYSPLCSTGVGYQPGPVAFGQQISLGSCLLGQSAIFLKESLRDPQVRLGLEPDIIPYLSQVIRDAKSAVEEVITRLEEAQKALGNSVHPDMRTSRYSTTSMPIPYSVDQSQGMAGMPTSLAYFGAAPYRSSDFRSTVAMNPFYVPNGIPVPDLPGRRFN